VLREGIGRDRMRERQRGRGRERMVEKYKGAGGRDRGREGEKEI